MIINGGARSGAKSLATHLLNRTKNERVEVMEVRGCLETDLRGALIEMEESAQATRCQRALYHANIDPDRNVKMTPEQWKRSIDRLEEKLELTNHPRAVVKHIKHGREHIHIVWNRIDLETMRTVRDSHNYRKHELVARELEREFGHDRVQGAHVERDGKERPERTPPKWVMQQGERLGVDPRQVKTKVQELWDSSDGGRSFAAALDNEGLTLAKGDRRDFMVVDQTAGVHSLGRCLTTKAAELRRRMADVDREALPTVEQAVAITRERQAAERTVSQEAVGKQIPAAAAELTKRLPEPAMPSLPHSPEIALDETALEIRRAYAESDNAHSFTARLQDSGIHLAAVTPNEALRSEMEHRLAKRQGSEAPLYQPSEIVAISPPGQVYTLDPQTMGASRADIDTFLGKFDHKPLHGIETTQEELALRAQQFMALTQVGVLQSPEPEKAERTFLPSPEEAPAPKVDWRRYIQDSAYRKEIQGRQENEPPVLDRQRKPGGLER